MEFAKGERHEGKFFKEDGGAQYVIKGRALDSEFTVQFKGSVDTSARHAARLLKGLRDPDGQWYEIFSPLPIVTARVPTTRNTSTTPDALPNHFAKSAAATRAARKAH